MLGVKPALVSKQKFAVSRSFLNPIVRTFLQPPPLPSLKQPRHRPRVRLCCHSTTNAQHPRPRLFIHPPMLQKNSTMSLLTQQLVKEKAALANLDRPDALRFLDEQLARGGLDTDGYNKLHEVLSMISEISLLLFPSFLGLEEVVMRRVKLLSKHIADAFHTFGEQIGAHLKSAQRAMQELPDLAVSQENIRRHNLQIWRRRLR